MVVKAFSRKKQWEGTVGKDKGDICSRGAGSGGEEVGLQVLDGGPLFLNGLKQTCCSGLEPSSWCGKVRLVVQVSTAQTCVPSCQVGVSLECRTFPRLPVGAEIPCLSHAPSDALGRKRNIGDD